MFTVLLLSEMDCESVERVGSRYGIRRKPNHIVTAVVPFGNINRIGVSPKKNTRAGKTRNGIATEMVSVDSLNKQQQKWQAVTPCVATVWGLP